MSWETIIALGLGVALVAFVVWLGRGGPMWRTIQEHPIRFFALIVLAAMGIFLAYMAVWLTNVLSSEGWCAKALQAEKISYAQSGGLTACIDLFKIQVQTLGTTLLTVIGSFAFGMVVLVVVVLAQSKAAAKLPGGAGFDIGGENAAAVAADKVAAAAEDKATEIKQEAGAPKEPPVHSGPAMPEPKP